MRALSTALALASVATAASCANLPRDLEDPSQGFVSMTMYGALERVSGDLEGVRTDSTTGQAVPAGVPYTEQLYAAGAELVILPDETSVLGNSLGMAFGARVGWLADATIETGMAAPDQALPFYGAYSASALATIVQRRHLVVALHGSLELALSPERLGDTREAWLAVYGGARAYADAGPARVRLGYDLMPFWAGESRLEHRVTAFLARRGASGGQLGVRAALALGQNRLAEGGLNDTSLTIGVEVGL